ncbi:MAG TPA: helix-turn-helix domain-containing protein [Nitrososphaeraceae archaeon]|nr:helix-turn-helix domain-containing protein [Nitrososphaeraceae archaeon]
MQKSSSVSEEEKERQYPTLISEWLLPGVNLAECPIKASLGVLGKKWALLVLRDIGILGIDRFNRILDSLPGLTPRVLSMRLRELEKEGVIRCIEKEKSPMVVRWALTEKGRDILPILLQYTAFGSKWHADVVFEDRTPRKLNELFKPKAIKIILGQDQESKGN